MKINEDLLIGDSSRSLKDLEETGNTYYVENFNISCSANAWTTLCTLELPPGKYIITGRFHSNTSDVRWYCDLQGTPKSCYDSQGDVADVVTYIKEISSTENQVWAIWPSKDITVDFANIVAILITN